MEKESMETVTASENLEEHNQHADMILDCNIVSDNTILLVAPPTEGNEIEHLESTYSNNKTPENNIQPVCYQSDVLNSNSLNSEREAESSSTMVETFTTEKDSGLHVMMVESQDMLQETENQPEISENNAHYIGDSDIDHGMFDIIQSFQCKLCPHICYQMADISAHIKGCHSMSKRSIDMQSMSSDNTTNNQLINGEKMRQFSSDILSKPPKCDILLDTLQSAPIYNNDQVANSNPMKMDNKDSVYMCGQCTLSFATISECKHHMVLDHQVNPDSIDTEIEYPNTSEIPSNKCSVGVQVSMNRKPGRKPKPSIKREISPPPSPEVISFDSDKEDELTTEVMVTETRKKRKVRPPSRLSSLYYLPRKKKQSEGAPVQANPFRCTHLNCNMRFKRKPTLEIHEQCHQSNNSLMLVCFKCGEEFEKWKLLRLHLWGEHMINTDLLACSAPGCDFHAENKTRLALHMESHGEEYRHQCDDCPKSFRQISQLQSHRSIHRDRSDGEKWYNNLKCPTCERTFQNSRTLGVHIQAVHSSLKPYTCQFCSYTASRKQLLIQHQRTHTGEKPFSCTHCGFRCADHNSLRRHTMRHTGQKKYRCVKCSYSCIQSTSLKIHYKTKHEGYRQEEVGIFSCAICPYITVNRKQFREHEMDHKNGLINVNAQKDMKEKVVNKPKQSLLREAKPGESLLTMKADNNADNGGSVVALDPSSAQIILSALAGFQNSVSNSGGASTETGSYEVNMPQTLTLHLPNQGDTGGVSNEGTVYLTLNAENQLEPSMGGMADGSTSIVIEDGNIIDGNGKEITFVQSNQVELDNLSNNVAILPETTALACKENDQKEAMEAKDTITIDHSEQNNIQTNEQIVTIYQSV